MISLAPRPYSFGKRVRSGAGTAPLSPVMGGAPSDSGPPSAKKFPLVPLAPTGGDVELLPASPCVCPSSSTCPMVTPGSGSSVPKRALGNSCSAAGVEQAPPLEEGSGASVERHASAVIATQQTNVRIEKNLKRAAWRRLGGERIN